MGLAALIGIGGLEYETQRCEFVIVILRVQALLADCDHMERSARLEDKERDDIGGYWTRVGLYLLR